MNWNNVKNCLTWFAQYSIARTFGKEILLCRCILSSCFSRLEKFVNTTQRLLIYSFLYFQLDLLIKLDLFLTQLDLHSIPYILVSNPVIRRFRVPLVLGIHDQGRIVMVEKRAHFVKVYRLFAVKSLCFMLLILSGCRVDIENPDNGDVYTVGDTIHFEAEYNGTGEIRWQSDYTDPNGNGGRVGNSAFKNGIVEYGKKYPWDFEKSNLPAGNHTITAYKDKNNDGHFDPDDDDDYMQVDIRIRFSCDQIDCSHIGDGQCIYGVCNEANGECEEYFLANGTGCDDFMTCTDNDQCVEGVCLGQDTCQLGMFCAEEGCVWDSCTSSADCSFMNSECQFGICSASEGHCTPYLFPGYCFIDDECIEEGTRNPLESCEYCDSNNPTTWSPLSNVLCSDNDACTTGDRCEDGICKYSGELSCNDGNPCTADVCDSATGCIHYADDEGTCDIDESLTCVVGTCEGGECRKQLEDLYCLIDNECIPQGQSSENGCGYCDSSIFKTRWTWNEETEGQACSTGENSIACGAYTCHWGQCTLGIDENSCYIRGECVYNGEETTDQCWLCDTEKSQYSGTFVGGDECEGVNASYQILADPSDFSYSPVAFSSQYLSYSKEVPAMKDHQAFDKTFFMDKTFHPVMATCEVKDSSVEVVVLSYPGLREIHRKQIWTTTVNDFTFCPVDSADLNGDGFHEIVVGAPWQDTNISGQIVALDVGELNLRLLSPGTIDIGDSFSQLKVGKEENQAYIVIWNALNLKTYRFDFSNIGELTISSSPVWTLSTNYISSASIANNNVTIVGNSYDWFQGFRTKIFIKTLSTGDDFRDNISFEGWDQYPSVSCGDNIYLANNVDNFSSNIYVIDIRSGNQLQEIGQTSFPIARLYCLQDVEWLRMPREIDAENQRRDFDDSYFTFNKDPDRYDYLRIANPSISDISGAFQDNPVGELELELIGGQQVEINSPIAVDHLILSGSGSLVVNTADQNFENITINSGKLETVDDFKVGVEQNLVLAENADTRYAAFNFNGAKKSVIGKKTGGDVSIGSLHITKQNADKRVVVDSGVGTFQVGSLGNIQGFLDIGESTSFKIDENNETVVGVGTIHFRGPSFSASAIDFKGVNLYVSGQGEENRTIFNVTGQVSVAADFKLHHVEIPSFYTDSMVFDVSNAPLSVVEMKDVILQTVNSSENGNFIKVNTKNEIGDIVNESVLVYLDNVMVDSSIEMETLTVETDTEEVSNWFIGGAAQNEDSVSIGSGLSQLRLLLKFNDRHTVPPISPRYIKPLINSSPKTEMLGYPRVGFIDGINCEMWPKQIDFNSIGRINNHSPDVYNRIYSTGIFQDVSIDSEPIETMIEYLGKSRTNNALVFGSKYGFDLSNVYMAYILKDKTITYDRIPVVVDPFSNIGYALDPRYLCTENDLLNSECDFISAEGSQNAQSGYIINHQFARGTKIDKGTQILIRKARRNLNKMNRDPVKDNTVDALIIAAPIVTLPLNLSLEINTIFLGDVVKGHSDYYHEPLTNISIDWVGNGYTVEDDSCPTCNALERLWNYFPQTPAFGIIAANNVSGIKRFSVANKALYDYRLLEKFAQVDIALATDSYWEGPDNLQDPYNRLRVLSGILHEDSVTFAENLERSLTGPWQIDILDVFSYQIIQTDDHNKRIRFKLNLPKLHKPVEGGLSAIYSDNKYWYAKVSEDDTAHSAKRYNGNHVFIENESEGFPEILDAFVYKIYTIIDQLEESGVFPVQEIDLCIESKDYRGGSDWESCETKMVGYGIDYYCINPCGVVNPVCVNEECNGRSSGDSTQCPVYFGDFHSTLKCQAVGEDADLDREYLPPRNVDLGSANALRLRIHENEADIKVTLKEMIEDWKSRFSTRVQKSNGPKSSGIISENLTKDLQFALSNGELFRLYLQIGEREDKIRTTFENESKGWKQAYNLLSASPFFPENIYGARVLDEYWSRFYRSNTYIAPANNCETLENSDEECTTWIPQVEDQYSALNIEQIEELVNRYNYDPASLFDDNMPVNTIGIPYGNVARSWYQIGNYSIQNPDHVEIDESTGEMTVQEDPDNDNPCYCELETENDEPCDCGGDSFLDAYSFQRTPKTFTGYIEKWYELKDTINLMLDTLREKREDAIYDDILKARFNLMGNILVKSADQDLAAIKGQVVDFSMLVDSLKDTLSLLTVSNEQFVESAGNILGCNVVEGNDDGDICTEDNSLYANLNKLSNKCYDQDLPEELANAINSTLGVTSVTNKLSKKTIEATTAIEEGINNEVFESYLRDLEEQNRTGQCIVDPSLMLTSYAGLYSSMKMTLNLINNHMGILSDVSSEIIPYVKSMKVLLKLLGAFESDPCPGITKKIVESMIQDLKLQMTVIMQLQQLVNTSSNIIANQMKHVELAIKHLLELKERKESLQTQIKEWKNNYVNTDWVPDQYDRYGLKNTCDGLRMAVDAAQREMYTSSQILHNTMGHTYVPSYLTIPAMWDKDSNDFTSPDEFGFLASLWDSQYNFKFKNTNSMRYDELSPEPCEDSNMCMLFDRITTGQNAAEESIANMPNSYASLISEGVNNISDQLVDRAATVLPARFFPAYTFVVKTLDRYPCEFYEESTGEQITVCEEEDEQNSSCWQEEYKAKQAKYCDRSNINQNCNYGSCAFGGLADAFLSKGVAKFEVSPEDLAALTSDTYNTFIKDGDHFVSLPVVQQVYYKVYYEDRWCQYNAYTGKEYSCCTVPDLDGDQDEGYSPLHCPGDWEQFSFFGEGFDGDNSPYLFIVNAASRGLKPAKHNELQCEHPHMGYFKDLYNNIHKMGTCSVGLLSWPEMHSILFKNPTGSTNTELAFDEFPDESFYEIATANLQSNHIRGLPVLGTWYLVYDATRAISLTQQLRSGNTEFGSSVPGNICYNEERDEESLPSSLMDQVGSEVYTPYEKYDQEHDIYKDMDDIQKIDVVFVVSRVPSPWPYWVEMEE